MPLSFSSEELRRLVAYALLDRSREDERPPPPTLTRVKSIVFDNASPDEQQQLHLRATYATELSALALVLCKNDITTRMNPKDAESTIEQYESCLPSNQEDFFNCNQVVLPMLDALKEESLHEPLFEELDAFFLLVKSKVARSDKEDAFRDVLSATLQSGEMTRSEWELIRQWKEEGALLHQFKKIFGRGEKGLKRPAKAAQQITTVEFGDLETMQTLLEGFCAFTRAEEGDPVTVTSRTVFLSEHVKWIEERLQKGARSVSIYAQDCCGLDVSLSGTIWSGVNLAIVSKILYVWSAISIDLSGSTPTLCGAPGGSSGNLTARVKQVIHGDLLSVKVDGGQGADGAAGKDGVPGKPGVGIDEDEIRACDIPNRSLYVSGWQQFLGTIPRMNGALKIKMDEFCEKKKFLHYEFVDAQGHLVTYSVASDGRISCDLIIIVRGTDGKPGTNGSEGGLGGEGGFSGHCLITNAAGDHHHIGNISDSFGKRGKDGNRGKNGEPGKNGHDMALVQRAGSPAVIVGRPGHRLVETYLFKREPKSWYSGYRRHVQERDDCYLSFNDRWPVESVRNIPSSTILQQQRQKATATPTINLDEELHRFEAVFPSSKTDNAAISTEQNTKTHTDTTSLQTSGQHQCIVHCLPIGQTNNPVEPEEFMSTVIPSQLLAEATAHKSNAHAHLSFLFNLFRAELTHKELENIGSTIQSSIDHLRKLSKDPIIAAELNLFLSREMYSQRDLNSYLDECASLHERKLRVSLIRSTSTDIWRQLSESNACDTDDQVDTTIDACFRYLDRYALLNKEDWSDHDNAMHELELNLVLCDDSLYSDGHSIRKEAMSSQITWKDWERMDLKSADEVAGENEVVRSTSLKNKKREYSHMIRRLKYNLLLYNVHDLYCKGESNENLDLWEPAADIPTVLDQYSFNPYNNRCWDAMRLKGFGSVPFRYLHASYTDSGDQEARPSPQQSTREQHDECYPDATRDQVVVMDFDLRELRKAQRVLSKDETTSIVAQIVPETANDHVCALIEEEMEMKMNRDVLRALSSRFSLDGRHLSREDLLFVVDSADYLIHHSYCLSEFIVACCMRLPQCELVDFMVLLRMAFHLRSRKISPELMNQLRGLGATDMKSAILERLETRSLRQGVQPQELDQVNVNSEISHLTTEGSTPFSYYLQKLRDWDLMKSKERLQRLLIDFPDTSIDSVAQLVYCILSREIESAERMFKKLTGSVETCDDSDMDSFMTECRTATAAVDLVVAMHGNDERVRDEKKFWHAKARRERIDTLLSNVRARMAEMEQEERGEGEEKQDEKTNTSCLRQFEAAIAEKMDLQLRASQRVSILCALESKNGLLQQVPTGEGKSLIIAGIAAVTCLRDSTATVDIITSSETLAKRDAERMRPIFTALGLTVSHNCCERREQRENAYKARIVYGDMTHFQRDYLIHEYYRENIRGSRKMDMVIVDEVDNMLLDNGNNTLYLSHSIPCLRLLDSLLFFIDQQVCDAESISSTPFQQHDNSVVAMGVEKIRDSVLEEIYGPPVSSTLAQIPYISEKILSALADQGLIDAKGYLLLADVSELHKVDSALSNFNPAVKTHVRDCFSAVLTRERAFLLPTNLLPFVHRHLDELIGNCFRASRMVENTDYVLDADRTGRGVVDLEIGVTIIDRNTGADMSSSQWAGGLHQFLEIRHACRVSPVCLKAVFVSNVSYLKQYAQKRVRGLSGTLGSLDEKRALEDLYGVDLISVPTNRPRRFYESLPTLATTRDQWICALDEQIDRMMRNGRAVLVVCASIHQLDLVHEELLNRHPSMNERPQWLSALTTYRRQHDEFEFEKLDSCVQAGQLIIATNLAGRGTDIHLSEDVIKAGGLHVIVAFLPSNERVEEQAFGRAARTGQPGSAQIIACEERINGDASIVDRIRTRDIDERRRLRALKLHYYRHTVVEEACLAEFRRIANEKIFKTNHTKDRMPEASQVIYSAMLDKWALWLDEQEPEMKKWKGKGRDAIVGSVTAFVKRLDVKRYGERLSIPSWIDSGERLLALGIVLMSHEFGLYAADRTFMRIRGDYAAFAFYYRACMRMDGFANMRAPMSSMDIYHSINFENATPEALRLFKHARALFVAQLARKQRQIGAALTRASLAEGKCGLRSQLEAMTTAYGHIISNIDWLIGAPLCEKIFEECFEEKGEKIFASMKRVGIISPFKLSFFDWMEKKEDTPFDVMCNMQCEQIQYALGLPQAETRRIVKKLAEHKELPMGRALIEKNCKLPARSTFWKWMKKKGVFVDEQIVCVVAPGMDNKVAEALGGGLIELGKKSEDQEIYLRFSNDAVHGRSFYSTTFIAANPEQGQMLLEDGSLQLDLLARIDAECLRTLPYLPVFEGFTLADMVEHLDVSGDTARRLMTCLIRTRAIHTGHDRTVCDEQPPTNCTADEKAIYRLVRLDCIDVEPVFLKPLRAFFLHRCAFTRAIDNLISACAASVDSMATLKQVVLPEDPYSELIQELTQLEVISAPRFEMTMSGAEKIIDYDDYNYTDGSKLRQFVNARRCKIEDSTSMFALLPFADYVHQRGGKVDSEMRALMDIGMIVGVAAKKSKFREVHGNALEKTYRAVGTVTKGAQVLCYLVGRTIGFLAHKLGQIGRKVTQIAGKLIPTKAKSAKKSAYAATSTSIDGIADVISTVGQGLSWLPQQIFRVVKAGSEMLKFSAIVAALMNTMKRINIYCQASIGTYRYFAELQQAACENSLDELSEHTIIRLYNDIACGARRDAEAVTDLETSLRAELSKLSRKLEADLLEAAREKSKNSIHDSLITKTKEEIFALLKGTVTFQKEVEQAIAFNAVYGRRRLTDLAHGSSQDLIRSSGEKYAALEYASNALREELKEVLREETRKGETDMQEFKTEDYCLFIKNIIYDRVASMFEKQASNPHAYILSPIVSSLTMDSLHASRVDAPSAAGATNDPAPRPSAIPLKVYPQTAGRRDWLLSEFHRITVDDDVPLN